MEPFKPLRARDDEQNCPLHLAVQLLGRILLERFCCWKVEREGTKVKYLLHPHPIGSVHVCLLHLLDFFVVTFLGYIYHTLILWVCKIDLCSCDVTGCLSKIRQVWKSSWS